VDIHTRGVYTQPAHTAKPIKFKGYLVPEYFTATFYVIDNDGIKVTPANAKQFKTWTIELLLRVTKAETVDVVEIKTKGAKDYKGHIVITTKPDEPDTYSTLKARHFNQLQANRVRLISVAVQVAIQTNVYKKSKSGGHAWTLGDKVEITETELNRINDEIVEFSYTKLDGTFYETFAERYRQLVTEGDKTPIKTLQNLYYPDKSVKHVQSYATTCRKKGLLPIAKQGKNSPIRKTTKRKER
jgi:NOL1/NOP2/fmu family ribosome biogenesis protein